MIYIREHALEYRKDMSCHEYCEEVLTKRERSSLVACKCDGELVDTSYIPHDGARVEPLFLEDEEALPIIRHSAAHIMACAVKHLFPHVQVTIGPSTEQGFYYDFAVERPFTEEDLRAIEEEMRVLVNKQLPFTRKVINKTEARALCDEKKEPYKIEIIDSIVDDEISVYTCGDFEDICRGIHIPHTGMLRAFALLSVAGAYWRGNENNAMLSRIYGTAFGTEKALKQYLHQLEEAKKRDHRKLGKEFHLFGFEEEVAPGMVFWYPKGMLVRTILEEFLRKEHLRRGYSLVQAPQIIRRNVWELSGHYDNYKENMYFSEIDENQYGVKPMNCIGHMYIYNSELHSYKDLPVRYFELGVVHRYEKSGALHGLFRVRQFTQDDAHILCTQEQLEDELRGVLDFVRYILGIFGFSYSVAISTRPEGFIGSDESWELATQALINAVTKENLSYVIHEGDGAFYGPKIDVELVDSLGRKWQCSTIQCDFTLPERFQLYYIGADGERHRPVMVHRAILGSIERFIGILIESTAGALPLWLAPEQCRVIPVSEAHMNYAYDVCKRLQDGGVRVSVDESSNTLSYKVRTAQLDKIEYILVVGDKEVEGASVNVRLRSGKNLGMNTIEELLVRIQEECKAPFQHGGTNYKSVQ